MSSEQRLSVKIVTVSDGVVAGTREDASGQVLEQYFTEQGWNVVERASPRTVSTRSRRRFGVSPTVSTGSSSPRGHRLWSTGSHAGGHEGHARSGGARPRRGDAVDQPARPPQSRVAGTLGTSLIVNTPGSSKGCVETIGAVIDVLPHAVTLLVDNYDPIPRVRAKATVPVTDDRRPGVHGASGRQRRSDPPLDLANPWVGAVVVALDGQVFDGATEPPGGRPRSESRSMPPAPTRRGSTLYTTLEPCDHTGRTGPCSHALVESGVARVVIGVGDPDVTSPARASARSRRRGLRSPSASVPISSPSSLPRTSTIDERVVHSWSPSLPPASMAGRQRPTALAVDHRTGSPRRRPSTPCRERCNPRRGPHGAHDDPALTVRDWPRQRALHRRKIHSGWCSARRWPTPGSNPVCPGTGRSIACSNIWATTASCS